MSQLTRTKTRSTREEDFSLISEIPNPSWALIDLASMEHLRQPVGSEDTLLLDVRDSAQEVYRQNIMR
jgi:hypothetical protein